MELKIEYLSPHDLRPYEHNTRKHAPDDIGQIKASIEADGFNDPIGIWGDDNLIVEGHGRQIAAIEMGLERVPCIRLDHLTDAQRRDYAIRHNFTSDQSEFDFGRLREEVAALELQGLDMSYLDGIGEELDALGDSWFEREKRDGAERQEGNDEYNEFLEKFETKKTTDDCYTPDNIYDAVAGWVASRYKIDRAQFIRPFFPGGDYQSANYPSGCAVVDNPPFSILSEIIKFYQDSGVRFFLFGPSLACFNYIARDGVTAVAVYSTITYENGACVKTSFLTNMEGPEIAAFTDVELFRAIEEANDVNEAAMHANIPKYEYPDEVLTAAKMGWLCQYGQELTVRRGESVLIRALDAQKEQDKAIYGCGLLLSEQKTAERAAAERAAAERAAATRWQLSDREREIVRTLGK